MIYVFDVDGTICFNGQYIEPNLQESIKCLGEEYQVIFASARPIRDLLPIVHNFENNTLIGGNGSIISIDDQVEVIEYIPFEEYEFIKSVINDYNLDYIIDGSFDYSAKVSIENKIYKQLDPDNLAKNVELSKIKEPIKIILIDVPENLYNEIRKTFESYEKLLSISYHESDNNIDITAKDINKFTTLHKIISNQPYVAYGNDINDFELLKNAEKAYYITSEDKDLPIGNVNIVSSDSQSVENALRYL
ncbi:HAD hydrolase family protein [Staphylococcus pseudoxylosus]|uniref:HAD hydrolase family protein n=1 Tax=Staphylococcus pseudoxylosus TaxID=2282419 RepID=UPI001BDBF168|nr:HAD hydrolase family protein [Staphylococcus pseudoxylosus]